MVPNPDQAAIWLRHPEALESWLRTGDPLAIDTEFMRERSYWPRLALVQLGLDPRDALLDPLEFTPLTALGTALTEPTRTVLMHSGSEDLIALRTLLPAPMLGLYDTQVASAYAGLGQGLSYQALIATLLGIELGKQETRSNWLARPLSERQIDYARDDVRYLGRAAAVLDERIRTRGYEAWVIEDCQRLARQQFLVEPDPQPQHGFRGLWRWPLPAQAQLRRILHWREQAARERDLPRRWVLDDDSVIAAAERPEHSAARLAARLDDGPPGKRRSLQPLLNALERVPNDAELAATQPIPAPLDAELKQTVKRWKAKVEAEATRLDLPASLLCPRWGIESLARGDGWPSELIGWRSELLPADAVT